MEEDRGNTVGPTDPIAGPPPELIDCPGESAARFVATGFEVVASIIESERTDCTLVEISGSEGSIADRSTEPTEKSTLSKSKDELPGTGDDVRGLLESGSVASGRSEFRLGGRP